MLTPVKNKIKSELEELPSRMRTLPVDDRGYPVPWFVAFRDGKPEFRAMDGKKFTHAIKARVCWVCGFQLGVRFCFVAGPMCGINRISSEPPSHLECAQWSARNCPFLNNPHMVRREDEVVNTATTRDNVAGIGLTRNPGVAMLWITRSYELIPAGGGGTGVLLFMGEPQSVEWWHKGRKATRAEVLESIESGLPMLETVARQEKGGLEALERAKKRFEKWVPIQ